VHVFAYAPFPSVSGVVALRFASSGSVRAENIFPSYVLCRLRNGSLNVELDGEVTHWSIGQGLVIPPFGVTTFVHRHSEATVDMLLVPGENIEGICATLAADPVEPLPFVHDDQPLLAAFSRAYAAGWNPELAPARESLEVSLARATASLVIERSRRNPHAGAASPPVRRTKELIDVRYPEVLRLDELAHEAGVSKYHLLRQFRRHIGLAPHAYQVAVRIARARELLGLGLSGAEIAERVGFYDQSAFTRAFKRASGITPGAYGALVRRGPAGLKRALALPPKDAKCGA
jgi:AraC-like DNA-binding protein